MLASMERDEIIQKYGINLDELKQEQKKLAKQLEIKDKTDFSLADKFAAIDNVFIGNKIISSIIICDKGEFLEKDSSKKEYEISDRTYAMDKIRFPYLPGFRAYRELATMVLALDKLNEKPDIVLISGQGIIHSRLGLASHFSLITGIPSIGISDSIKDCEIKNEDIFKNKKKVGKVLISKKGSRPMYISPGDGISVETAYELVKKFINLPHKLPEPLHLAGKYGRDVKKELGI